MLSSLRAYNRRTLAEMPKRKPRTQQKKREAVKAPCPVLTPVYDPFMVKCFEIIAKHQIPTMHGKRGIIFMIRYPGIFRPFVYLPDKAFSYVDVLGRPFDVTAIPGHWATLD